MTSKRNSILTGLFFVTLASVLLAGYTLSYTYVVTGTLMPSAFAAFFSQSIVTHFLPFLAGALLIGLISALTASLFFYAPSLFHLIDDRVSFIALRHYIQTNKDILSVCMQKSHIGLYQYAAQSHVGMLNMLMEETRTDLEQALTKTKTTQKDAFLRGNLHLLFTALKTANTPREWSITLRHVSPFPQDVFMHLFQGNPDDNGHPSLLYRAAKKGPLYFFSLLHVLSVKAGKHRGGLYQDSDFIAKHCDCIGALRAHLHLPREHNVNGVTLEAVLALHEKFSTHAKLIGPRLHLAWLRKQWESIFSSPNTTLLASHLDTYGIDPFSALTVNKAQLGIYSYAAKHAALPNSNSTYEHVILLFQRSHHLFAQLAKSPDDWQRFFRLNRHLLFHLANACHTPKQWEEALQAFMASFPQNPIPPCLQDLLSNAGPGNKVGLYHYVLQKKGQHGPAYLQTLLKATSGSLATLSDDHSQRFSDSNARLLFRLVRYCHTPQEWKATLQLLMKTFRSHPDHLLKLLLTTRPYGNQRRGRRGLYTYVLEKKGADYLHDLLAVTSTVLSSLKLSEYSAFNTGNRQLLTKLLAHITDLPKEAQPNQQWDALLALMDNALPIQSKVALLLCTDPGCLRIFSQLIACSIEKPHLNLLPPFLLHFKEPLKEILNNQDVCKQFLHTNYNGLVHWLFANNVNKTLFIQCVGQLTFDRLKAAWEADLTDCLRRPAPLPVMDLSSRVRRTASHPLLMKVKRFPILLTMHFKGKGLYEHIATSNTIDLLSFMQSHHVPLQQQVKAGRGANFIKANLNLFKLICDHSQNEDEYVDTINYACRLLSPRLSGYFLAYLLQKDALSLLTKQKNPRYLTALLTRVPTFYAMYVHLRLHKDYDDTKLFTQNAQLLKTIWQNCTSSKEWGDALTAIGSFFGEAFLLRLGVAFKKDNQCWKKTTVDGSPLNCGTKQYDENIIKKEITRLETDYMCQLEKAQPRPILPPPSQRNKCSLKRNSAAQLPEHASSPHQRRGSSPLPSVAW